MQNIFVRFFFSFTNVFLINIRYIYKKKGEKNKFYNYLMTLTLVQIISLLFMN